MTDIRGWNGLRSNTLRPGQKLVIYTPGKAPAPQTSTSAAPTSEKTPPANTKTETKTSTTTSSTNSSSESSDTKYKYYTVKNGDNLWTIAKKFGTTVEALKKLNGFGNKIVLHRR